jgi:hypothetical protein
MKKTIAKAWTESKEKKETKNKMPDLSSMDFDE